jgi:ankyrin repeat protein
MTTPRLPERPNLEQLKRQAKELLRSARLGDAGSLARFRTLPAFADIEDAASLMATIALHDAQSVVARELGFASWKALFERVEELTLDLAAAVEQFVGAATEVRPDRAERLLQLFPNVGDASFHAALLLGDVDRVERGLSRQPAMATEPGGPRAWPPLLYLCHTSLGFGPPSRADGIVDVARRLLHGGADPNTRFPWLHHGVRRPALWGAVLVTRHLPLAEVLLDAGADPNDGVTLPLAASGDDTRWLDLLVAHGADVNQPWATDGSAALYAVLHWAGSTGGVRWLLEHGAEPDPVFTPNGETPLHVVAQRWRADLAEALVQRGADVNRRRRDGRTPYAVAELSGNRDVAEWLERHGGATELTEIDRLVAACSRGDRGAADAMLRTHPGLHSELHAEHYGALYRAAERDDRRALEAMLACGFDPNRADDEIGKTALHVAAMEGWPDAVRVLLAHGASVTARDREFHAQPLVWAADGFRTRGHRDGRDHDAVARLLLEAGSPVEWQPGEEPADEVLDIIARWRRSGDAAASAR